MLHHVAADISKHFQWLLLSPGGSMQHECDMRTAISCLLAAANQPPPLAGTITMIGALSAIVGIETKAMIDNRTQVFDVAMKNARTIEACVDRPPRD